MPECLIDRDPDEPGGTGLARTHPRQISAEQLERYERYMAEIFAALGLDLSGEVTRQTPRRFLDALLECTTGYEGDPKLVAVFDTECRGAPSCTLSQVIEGPIPFYCLCEHHAFPFFGRAYLGYIAHEHIIGISKLTRLVRLFARRFTLQERLGYQIAEELAAMLQPHGVAVYLAANHLCSMMRGVNATLPVTRTTAFRGEYEQNPALRSEFFAACGLGPGTRFADGQG